MKKDYDPYLKNLLAKYYNWMVKNDLSLTEDELENSVRICCFSWEGLAFKDTFVNKFAKEIDHIREIAEAMPTYRIDFEAEMFDSEGQSFTHKSFALLKRYKDEKFNDYVKFTIGNHYKVISITEEK